MWLTDTSGLKRAEVARLTEALHSAVEATDRYSRSEGSLPAYYSFLEALSYLYDLAVRYDKVIAWEDLASAVIRVACPSNWEMVDCGRLCA